MYGSSMLRLLRAPQIGVSGLFLQTLETPETEETPGKINRQGLACPGYNSSYIRLSMTLLESSDALVCENRQFCSVRNGLYHHFWVRLARYDNT